MYSINETIQTLVNERKILYLSFNDVAESGIFDFHKHLQKIEEVYRIHANRDTMIPNSDYLKYKNRPSYDRIITLLGYAGGSLQLSGLKQICSSTTNASRGFERASGLIILNDPDTQRPFAILEASQISAARTAAVTSLAVWHFAPSDIKKVAFIGCGMLSRTHARMWANLFKSRCSEISFYDNNSSLIPSYQNFLTSLGLKGIEYKSAKDTILDADVIIPLTTSEQPYIEAHWIKPGSLYSAVSLLDPKLEVLTQSNCIFVDDEKLCKHEGRPLQKLEEQGLLTNQNVIEIGRWLNNPSLFTRQKTHKIFFNPMGTIITDLALAASIVQAAIENNHGAQLSV